MSENDSTEQGSNVKQIGKITLRIEVSPEDAREILALLGDQFPPVEDLSEIHLIIGQDEA